MASGACRRYSPRTFSRVVPDSFDLRRSFMKQSKAYSFVGPIKPIAILGMALILGFLTACGSKKDAQSLVKAGAASSEGLVKYYDSLVEANTKYLRSLSYSTGITFDG